MNSSTRNVLRFLTLGLLVLAGASVSSHNVARGAAPDRSASSVKVLIADLDLTKPQGTATLYKRIRNAARTVCGPVDISLLAEKMIWDRCVEQSTADAVLKVDNTSLTAYYLAHTRRAHAIVTAQASTPVQVR